jgi:6-phosphogluconolactonase (cycloisomerase 2 family)
MIRRIAAFLLMGVAATIASGASVGSFIVTNNDVPIPHPAQRYPGSSATFYSLGPQGTLTNRSVVYTGGDGIAGGSFSYSRIAIVPQGADVCVFVSDAATNDIASISATSRAVIGNYLATASDSGGSNGIGLVANANYLYAGFSYSTTIATFEIQSGCTLSFVSDLFTVGLSGGTVGGMAIHGSTMVVTYGDGSVASFNIAAGTPVANNDAENSSSSSSDHRPNGVVISADGHYAIFGDASTIATIEVSDISSGKLKPTIAYNVGQGWNSSNVQLSPDNSVIFVTSSSGGEITAAFFDKVTGRVSPGCATPPLNGFYDSWSYAGGAALQLSASDSGYIYVPEFGGNGFSSIGVVQFTATGRQCTLTELATSPVVDNTDASSMLSIGIYQGN